MSDPVFPDDGYNGEDRAVWYLRLALDRLGDSASESIAKGYIDAAIYTLSTEVSRLIDGGEERPPDPAEWRVSLSMDRNAFEEWMLRNAVRVGYQNPTLVSYSGPGGDRAYIFDYFTKSSTANSVYIHFGDVVSFTDFGISVRAPGQASRPTG